MPLTLSGEKIVDKKPKNSTNKKNVPKSPAVFIRAILGRMLQTIKPAPINNKNKKNLTVSYFSYTPKVNTNGTAKNNNTKIPNNLSSRKGRRGMEKLNTKLRIKN